MIRLWGIKMKTQRVVVEEHNPSWIKAFLSIQEYLYQGIPKKFKIEHVGSTSVKGLSAKPIIDIDIVYEVDSDKELLIKKLARLGYVHEGDLGIVGREAFNYDGLPFMKHHLYVIKSDSKAYQDHRYFKEYLLDHEKERRQYGHLKMSLAKKHPYDIDSYCEGKSPLIEELLEKASAWIMEK